MVPLDATSDVAGPIARTVEDAVRLLEVTVGVDPADNLTTLQQLYRIPQNYTQFLQWDALKVSLRWKQPYHLGTADTFGVRQARGCGVETRSSILISSWSHHV